MKKIILLLLSVIFCISLAPCGVVGAAADDKNIENAIGLLSELGVVENITEQRLNARVTRGEFAEMLNTLINGDGIYTDSDYFTDARGNKAVNNLTMQGFFLGSDDGIFSPGENITAEEILTVLVRVCGAETYAKALGGNKTAYISAAKNMDLYDDKLYGTDPTLGNVLLILYKACRAETAEISSVENNSASYGMKTGKTMLAKYRDIYYTTGLMTANRHTLLSRKRTAFADKAAINGTEFKNTKRAYDKYLGMNVIAWYHDNSGDTPEIIYINADLGKTNVLKIDAEDVRSFKNNTLTYVNEADKTKSINFSNALAVIYNGIAAEGDFEPLFVFDTGTVTVYENSDEYNVAVIEAYEAVKLKQKDEYTMQFYTNRNDEFKIIDFDKAEDVHLYSANSGLGLGATQLMPGNFITVMRSQDERLLTAYLCDIKVSGVAESVADDRGERSISVNGQEYKFNKQFDTINETVNVNDYVDLRLDNFGRVVGFAEKSLPGINIGYIYKVGTKTGMENTVEAKIYTSSGLHETFALKEKIKVNGKRMEAEKAIKELSTKKGELIRQLVRYSANENNEINAIYTAAAYGAATSENEFREITDGTEKCYYIYRQHMLFPKYLLSNDTLAFIVPKESEEITEDNISVLKTTPGTPFHSEYNYVRCYKYDDTDPFVDALVTVRDSSAVIDSLMPVILVSSVRNEIGDNGSEVSVIEGYSNYMPVRVYASSSCDVSAVGKGDVIQYITNDKAEILRFTHVYDVSENKWSFGSWGGSSTNFRRGEMDNIYTDPGDSNRLAIALKYEGNIVEYLYLSPTDKFMVYDTKTNKIRIASASEIVGEKNSGNDEKYTLFNVVKVRILYD